MAPKFDLKNREKFDGLAEVFRTSNPYKDPGTVISICSSTCGMNLALQLHLLKPPSGREGT